MTQTFFKLTIAALLISGGMALAESNPPAPAPSGDNLAAALAAAFAGASATGGKSVSNATGGAGGQGGSATATGGNANQAQRQGQSQTSTNTNNNRASTGPISIDNSNRQRMAANTAATVIPGGYGPANCFGDTNPSGSFGASMQVFGWGVAANSQKASNVCAVAALAGPAVALGYLQKMDPNVPRPVVVQQPTGRLICPDYAPTYIEGKGCK